MTPLAALADLVETSSESGTSGMELARGGRPQEPWTLYPGEYGIFDWKTRSQF